MASGRATLQSIAVALAEAMTALLSFTPAQSNQQLAQQRALVAIEQALEARRNRVLLSQAEIAPIQWIAIIVIAVLILITLAMVLVEHRLARKPASQAARQRSEQKRRAIVLRPHMWQDKISSVIGPPNLFQF